MSLQTSAAHFLAIMGIPTNAGSYVLSSTRPSTNSPVCSSDGISNTLHWTWPAHMLNEFGGNLFWWSLTLQRSTNAINLPNGTNVVYFNGTNIVPIPDPNWTNVKQWTNYDAYHADNPNPSLGSYSDPWPVETPAMYRIICNCARGGDPVIPPYMELVWNTCLVVPTRCVTPTQIQGGTRLSWTAPDTSWWPGSFLQFLSYTRCTCGATACEGQVNTTWNRLTLDPSHFGSPTTYDIYKSSDGLNWGSSVAPGLVPTAGGALNLCYEFFDSGNNNGQTPYYYKVVAHPPSGPAITSNIIYAN